MRGLSQEGKESEPALLVGIFLSSSEGQKCRHVTTLNNSLHNMNEHFPFAGIMPGAGIQDENYASEFVLLRWQ